MKRPPSGLFDGLDEAAVDRVAEIVGTRMAAASAFASTALTNDPTVSPAEMVAGIAKAHLHGAAAALAAGEIRGTLEIDVSGPLARDAVRVILDGLKAARSAM